MSIARVRRNVLALAITVALLAVAAPASAVQIVRGDGSSWRPATVSVSQGEAVRWKAVFRAHVVKAYRGNWTFRRQLQQGDSARRVFNARGTFRFYCTIHGTVASGNCTGMCGKVRVLA